MSGSDRDAPHGLRVLGYFLSKSGNGEDITVAHGGWSADSDGHARYDRFEHVSVLGVPAGMLGVESVFGGARAPRTGARRGSAPVPPVPPVSSSSSSEDEEEVLSSTSGLPPGAARDDRVTAAGRKYSVYSFEGRQYKSLVACWRAFASQTSSRGDLCSPSSAASSLVDGEVSPPEPVVVTPVSGVRQPRSASHRRVRVSGRSALCNHPDPVSGALCSLPQSHDGNCDWWSGGRRR